MIDISSSRKGKVTIPDTVTKIGEGALENCNTITNIIIPSTVTTIEGSAFARCRKLKSVQIPASVKKSAAAHLKNALPLRQ